MKKRLLMILLVVALLVTAAVFAVQASGSTTETSAVPEQCPCGCGLLANVTWTDLTPTDGALTANTSMPAGHYRIMGSGKDTTTITTSATYQPASNAVVVFMIKDCTVQASKPFAFPNASGKVVHVIGDNGKIEGTVAGQRVFRAAVSGVLTINGNLEVRHSATVSVNGSIADIYYNGKIVVNGGQIYGGSSSTDSKMKGGAFHLWYYQSAGGRLEVNGGTIYAGENTTTGGAVCVDSGTFTMTDGTIYGADNTKGCAIYSLGSVSISGGKIYGAVASECGGAIAVEGGSLTVSGSADIIGTPKTGTASGYGGAIYFSGAGTFSMTGGTVRDGYAGSGGNIYQTSTGYVLVTGGTIKDGKAKYGGNISVENGTVSIKDTAAAITISGGTATTDGGNIYLGYTSADVKATGVINLTNATSKISGASATGNGGSIWSGYYLSIDKATIENSSAKNGGAIFVASGSTYFKDGSITGCSAANGGGVYVYSGTFDMSGGSITSCDATTNGGAGYISGTFKMSGTASVEVSANSKTKSGAGLRVQNGTMTMSGTSSIKGLGNTDNTAGYAIDLVGAGKAASLTMSDSAKVYSADNSHRFNINVNAYSSAAKLTITAGWQGEASVKYAKTAAFEPSVAPGAMIGADHAAATGAYTGKLYAENVYIQAKQLTGQLLANGTQLQVAGTYIKDNKGIEWYLNNAEAVAAYEQGDVIKLVTTEALDLNGKEVYVDFGGQDVEVSDTLGTGKLYGIDTETGFTTEEAAANVTGVAAQPYAVDPLTGKGYVALNGSFYPIQVQMGGVGVNPATTGIYFNSTVKYNPAIESCIKAYGLAASLGAEPNETFWNQGSVAYTFSAGVPADSFNGFITGILGNGDDATTGTTNVQAKGYVLLNINGTEQIVLSELGQESLQSAMVAINAKWGELEDGDKTAVLDMYKKYAVMEDWDLNNIAGDAV